MVVTDIIRFGLFLSIPFWQSLWWLFAASFLIECASLFWIPAKEASIPNLVPREPARGANQLNLVTTYGFGAVAAAVFCGARVRQPGARARLLVLPHQPGQPRALHRRGDVHGLGAHDRQPASEINRARRPPRTRSAGLDGEQVGFWQSITAGRRGSSGRQRWLKGLVIGICGATGAGAAVIGLSQSFARPTSAAATRPTARCSARCSSAWRAGMFLGPRLIGAFSRRRVVGLGIVACGITLAIDARRPQPGARDPHDRVDGLLGRPGLGRRADPGRAGGQRRAARAHLRVHLQPDADRAARSVVAAGPAARRPDRPARA